ncbi:MAG TPA: hypothetical protein VIV06_00320 [Candidatus Limnocylindrales bacterium]
MLLNAAVPAASDGHGPGDDAPTGGEGDAGGPDGAITGGEGDAGDGERASPRGAMTVSDYERAMSERNQLARARGLSAPYIPGGEDPDPERTRRAERVYIRLLVLMVALIVVGGFVISIIGLIVVGDGAPP